MKLVFQKSADEEREIANVTSYKECCKAIKDFLDEHNYKSYYTRIEKGETYIKFDVGSWTQFFILYGTKQEIADILKEE